MRGSMHTRLRAHCSGRLSECGEGCQLEFKPRSITQSRHSGGLTPPILHPWGQLICPEGTGPRRAWLLAAKWLGGKF